MVYIKGGVADFELKHSIKISHKMGYPGHTLPDFWLPVGRGSTINP